MRNAGLDEAEAGIKTARRNINNLRYADDTTLMAESEEPQEPVWEGVTFHSACPTSKGPQITLPLEPHCPPPTLPVERLHRMRVKCQAGPGAEHLDGCLYFSIA